MHASQSNHYASYIIQSKDYYSSNQTDESDGNPTITTVKHTAWKTATSRLPHLKDIPKSEALDINQEGSIGIDTSRLVKEFLSTRPINSTHKLVNIQKSERLTIAAQNALLKILEEPPQYATLLLWSANPYQLIPTIRSRCRLLTISSTSVKVQKTQSLNSLIGLSHGQRLTQVDEYAKTRTTAQDFINETIYSIRQDLKQSPQPKTLYNLTLALYVNKLLTQNVNVKLALGMFFLNLK